MAEDSSGDLVRKKNPLAAFAVNLFQEDGRVVVRDYRLNDPGRGREELGSVGRDCGLPTKESRGPPYRFAGPFESVK